VVEMVKGPHWLWAQIWKQKYAPTTSADKLIHHNDQIQGSNIWNTAWKNRELVQKHAFWEIQNGENALFWQDSWQQQKPLDQIEELSPLRKLLHTDTFQHVKDFWRPGDRTLPWRQWRTSTQELQIPESMDLHTWRHYASHRKIPT
jgi:hypothetical protein